MSRTAFATHFAAVLGVSPIGYLFRWRMALARQALATPDEPIAAMARRLGYGSASAFSTAFSRSCGDAPANYRRTMLLKEAGPVGIAASAAPPGIEERGTGTPPG
ncbi:helix-turn-helix transcriptional regulator [Acetobacteraceae bacterium KSS12]|uniref:Helix-turn-helix transcriptional regulator n=2 Tax=Rhizosaccharibacter radicis TaxID=2782605 RepID=A0ABT1VSY3_9PROT|nr:helix-turn-helix transcriptional regulator [Acetobacteraceae bacterium KSS12]